jgi:hypothetical protein
MGEPYFDFGGGYAGGFDNGARGEAEWEDDEVIEY